MDGHGSYLGRKKGYLFVKDREGREKRYPIVNNVIEEVQIWSGNCISSAALVTLVSWGINCVLFTQRGEPVAILRDLSDDSHVRTRICQCKSLDNVKGFEAARQFVLAKLEGQSELLKKYGLRPLDSCRYSEQIKAIGSKDLKIFRSKLMSIEGKFSSQYFSQIFLLFNESYRPKQRRGFKTFDGLNNILNLAYSTLSCKVYMALTRAKLETHLGFLHSTQWKKPSLVCDFQEIYRYLIENFVIDYCKTVQAEDFVLKVEDFSANRSGERQYLNQTKTRDFVNRLDRYFETKVSIPRMRNGGHQEIETLINEEAFLFAKYLRDERPTWSPRIVAMS